MNVKQLIAELAKLPSDATVYGWDDGSIFVVNDKDETIQVIDTD